MNLQKGAYSRNPPDLQLINDLERIYIEAWNSCARSGGKGPATGKAFEDWIVSKLKANGKSVEKGKISFRFGDFQVDAAIPSVKNPKTILEIKICTDIQHSLMLEGLVNNLADPNIKVGLVTFYEPGTNYAKNSLAVKNILNNLKRSTKNRFNYFHMQNGWSREIRRFINFC